MDLIFLRYPGGKSKAVTFSYDDGVRQDVRLSGLFCSYGLKGTFNINSGFVPETDSGGRMSYREIKEHILDKGHEVAVHGDRHIAPGSTDSVGAVRDVLDCRIKLERNLGVIVRGMAYPNSGIRRFVNGLDYPTLRNYLEGLGIAYSRTLAGDNDSFRLPEDWYSWMPTAHHGNPAIFDWAQSFVDLDLETRYMDERFPRLFYVWGHSYEFDRDDGGWERMEKLCALLANRDDVWYATNMEIRSYVGAYYSLIKSADGDIVSNPTTQEIFLYADGEPVSVKPGQTIRLRD